MNGMKKRYRLLLLMAGVMLLILLGGCRVRTTPESTPGGNVPDQVHSGNAFSGQEEASDRTAGAAEAEPEISDSGDSTRENPEADRKEYDADADAEIIPGASHSAAGEGTGEAASRNNPEAERRESMLGEDAEKSATRIVSVGEADRMGVAEDAKTAETVADYYRVLLTDRLGTLMECKRLYAYWETADEWRTVFRTSPEHRMIMDSGCYDVSGRLTEERLLVDAGWVVRKNPDVIIRVAPAGTLGSSVFTTFAAENIRSGMMQREGWSGIRAVQAGRVILIAPEMTEAPHLKLTAELLIAKTAYPELFPDVDVREALKALTEEATGTIPEAVFFYNGGE